MSEPQPQIPPSFFRVSVKALVIQDGKLLLFQEHDGRWELPGGGLEGSESFLDGLRRELQEEAGLKTTWINPNPIYLWTQKVDWKDPSYFRLTLAFHTKLESFNLDPTKKNKECVALDFFSKENLATLNLHPVSHQIAGLFNPDDFTDPNPLT